MPFVLYLQSVQNPELTYKIVKFDAATKTATLQGKYGTFTIEPFTKEKVTSDGYTLLKVEEPA